MQKTIAAAATGGTPSPSLCEEEDWDEEERSGFLNKVPAGGRDFALVDDRDRAYFGRGEQDGDQFGYIDGARRAIFGRSYAAEPDVLIEQLREDEAIAEADTLLLTVPNQLGVAYNAHVLEAVLTTVAPALGWR